MQSVNTNNPADRKKLIWAIGLGFIAIVFLWWTFIGFGSGNKTTTRVAVATPSPSPIKRVINDSTTAQQSSEARTLDNSQLRPVEFNPVAPPSIEARRNIFAFYEPPPPPVKTVEVPPSTPTPTPPVLLAAVSPANVYARTADFTLEVTGDKFSPNLRITLDGRELPTRYINGQQLTANVNAAFITNPGQRQVLLRSPDGKLYSNQMVLNVSQPPVPNYTYIGIIGTIRHVDTAILQDRSNREIMNVQRGDVLGGTFRVTSISEKELVLVDTNLKIKHTIPFTVQGEKSFNPLQRPTPKVDSEDDEPQ